MFTFSLQNDDVQDFDVGWDQALLSVSELPSDVILEGMCMSKLQDSVQLQDCLGFARPRDCSKQWTDKLLTIEDVCKTSYPSDDENSKLQGSE